MYKDQEKIRMKNGAIATVIKKFSVQSYIIDLRLLDSKNRIVSKGRILVEEDDLNKKDITFFKDKNSEKKSNRKKK